jgi:lauroyl/myristoyl acyltransferase
MGTDRRQISAKDLYEVPRLAIQGAYAWLLPEPAWRPASILGGKVNAATHPARTRKEIVRIRAGLGETVTDQELWAIASRIWENRYEERFQYLRAWRPGGWKPKITVIGEEHVRAALAQGKGILFWASNFSFNDLVTKMAWHQIGLHVWHFSRPAHGFSETRFGIRFLNAVRRNIEDRFLGSRLMTEDSETRIALAQLREHLSANGTVSFTVGNKGRNRVQAEFMQSRIEFATGPLHLAHSVGAPILPVFTLRNGAGVFDVTFGSPLRPPIKLGEGQDFTPTAQDYADRLTPFVLREPGQWKGWRFVCDAEPRP